MLDEIVNAIRERRVLVVWYDPGARIIEPHCLGRSTEGHYLLRAYQTSGASESGAPVNWKLFRVDRIESLEPTDDTFDGTRPEYNPRDPIMRGGIIAHL